MCFQILLVLAATLHRSFFLKFKRMKPVYIKGMAAISPQKTFQQNKLSDEIIFSENNLLRCIEPKYSDYLNPVMARRMSRIIKMGIACAVECLKDAHVEMPGAIITGTALGCLGDTEKFLESMLRDDEQFLTPTHFIQSIQNSVAGQIALHLKCTNHNFTFVHKGFSFENALFDSLMLLQENDANHILVGGLDEMTDKNYHIYEKLGLWKREKIKSTELFQHHTTGTIGGEGATFFILGKEQGERDYAVLRGVKTIYNQNNSQAIAIELQKLFHENHLTKQDISLVIYGDDGNPENDLMYHHLRSEYFQSIAASRFKQLCGEYQTAGAFAMWLATSLFQNSDNIHQILMDTTSADALKNIVVINNYENNISIYFLSKK
jgi:3-oxoacyl-[acyl-carrier-protein] synthase II